MPADQASARSLATRLLLTPIALICLVAGLLPLAIAGAAAGRGLHLGLLDPALAPSLHQAVLAAAAASLPALILGLTGAATIRGAPTSFRFLVIAIAICLLALPAPMIAALPILAGSSAALPSPGELARFGCAVARGAGLVLLITSPAVQAITPGLRRAAQSAGATRLQAWQHVVLRAVFVPALLGWAGAFLVALAQTPAAAILGPHLDLADAWIAPASLLLVACSLTAVLVLMRR